MSSPDLIRRSGVSASLWGLRTLLVLGGIVAWFGTQALLGSRGFTGDIGDGVLGWLSPVHDYFFTHVAARDTLLITSSAVIDGLALFIFARAIFGETVRPFVGVLCIFLLRQVFQALCVLPAPPEMIWPKEGPGFPSLFVTYGVSNDLFFSGHTALAVFGATELGRVNRGWMVVGIFVAVFEMFTVLALRAHWTMDVYAGAVTALLVAVVGQRIADPIDGILARMTGTGRPGESNEHGDARTL